MIACALQPSHAMRAAVPTAEPAVLADEAAIAALAAGDEGAFTVLYDRYARAVFSLALRITRDRDLAEEITQEAFLRLWRRAATYTPARGRLPTWLLTVTHHLAIDQLRRRRTRPPADLSTDDWQVQVIPDARADIEEAAWVRARRDLVLAALARLPAAQRRVIELAYFAGLTQTEIAARLAMPLGTVKTRLRLGLLKMRDLMQAQGMAASP